MAVGTTVVRALESAALEALVDAESAALKVVESAESVAPKVVESAESAALEVAGGRGAEAPQGVVRGETRDGIRAAELSTAPNAWSGETRLFIRPGFEFQVVDAMVTNFHLPESTLLMLVSAFAGRENVLGAYAHAVRERYRFFSYGDAMFVMPARPTKRQLTTTCARGAATP